MAGTFPSTPEPATATLTYVQPVFASMSESAKRQSRISGGHLWRIELNWDKNTREFFAPLYAFIASQRGRFDSFQIVLATHKTPIGAGGGTPLTNGAVTEGAETVATDGWPASTTVLKAGDVFKFNDHSKVYLITSDATTDGTGAVTLNLTPPVIKAVSDGIGLTTTGVQFTVAMNDDMLEWKASAPHLVGYSLDLVEHIV